LAIKMTMPNIFQVKLRFMGASLNNENNH